MDVSQGRGLDSPRNGDETAATYATPQKDLAEWLAKSLDFVEDFLHDLVVPSVSLSFTGKVKCLLSFWSGPMKSFG